MQYPKEIAKSQVCRTDTMFLRPTLHEDEWWWCYVVRTLWLNEYRAHREYIIRQLEPYIANAIGSVTVDRLRAGDDADGGVRLYANTTVPKWAVSGLSSNIQICPQCLADAAYVRLHWRLLSTTVCQHHSALLISRCPSCSSTWRVWDIVRGTCRCGRSIHSTTPNTIDSYHLSSKSLSLVGLVSTPTHAEASTEVALADAPQSPVPTNRDTCSTKIEYATRLFLHRLIRRLSGISIRGVTSSCDPLDPLTPYRWLDNQDISIELNVSGISKLWCQLRSVAYLRAALECVCRLFHEEKCNPTLMSRLPLMKWAKELAGLGANVDKVIKRSWIPEGSISLGMYSLKRAAEITGVRKMHIHFLMRKNLIQPAGYLTVGAPQHLFTPDQLNQLRLLKPKAFGMGSEMNLGLPKMARNVLRCTTILDRRADAHGVNRFLEQSIRQLFDDLDRHSKPLESATGPLFQLCDTRLWTNTYPLALTRIFSELRKGVHAIFTNGESPGFSRYLVGPELISSLRMYSRCIASNDDCSQYKLSSFSDLPSLFPCGTTRRPGSNRRQKRVALHLSEYQIQLFDT